MSESGIHGMAEARRAVVREMAAWYAWRAAQAVHHAFARRWRMLSDRRRVAKSSPLRQRGS